ncbi:organic cyclic compound binding protein [[Candida] boidinii]|nr:organic cyclic compound binding protein [[Candida] boidinii]
MSATEETKKDDNLDRKTLFVRSVPFDANDEELTEFFSQFCPVRHGVIVRDNEKNSRGFGFVSFGSEEDALTALKDSKSAKFKNRLLRVDVAKRRDRKDSSKPNAGTDSTEEKPAKKSQEKNVEKSSKIIIRNLPWSIRDANQLSELFKKYGGIKTSLIPRKNGGRMSGFGFVTFKKSSSARAAVTGSKGLKIDDREVAVDLAVDKTKWEEYKETEPEKVETNEKEEDEEEEDDDDEEDAKPIEEKEDEEKEEKENADEDNEDEDDDDEDFEKENFGAADEDEDDKRPKANRQEQFSIFVRNVPYDATEESLGEHFAKFGPIKYALPVVDRVTGLARGSAFVAFRRQQDYESCLLDAPVVNSSSMLIPDDVSPLYVYEGRVLSVAATVDRESASKLADKNADARKELLGRAPGEKDRRNLFLLSEGRITERSKLASVIRPTDMALREKSYNLRVQQLNKNPGLHMSLTRLAIRNIPRSMTQKSLKALGRKAVVQFAKEVKDGLRQPLSKEEISRSIDFKHKLKDELSEKEKDLVEEQEKRKTKKTGVVSQAKIVQEVKGSGEIGRSRGYGFLEFRDHKSALSALRWLNAHEITRSELQEGMTDEEKKASSTDNLKKRRLIVEFAVENANVVKRRRERSLMSRVKGLKRRRDAASTGGDGDDDDEETSSSNGKKRPRKELSDKKKKNIKRGGKKGNMNKGGDKSSNGGDEGSNGKSGLSNDVKKLIGIKRRRKQGKK